MKKFALTIAALALIASTSQACPLFGRRTKCSGSNTTYVVQCSNAQAQPKSEVVVVQHTEVKPQSAPVIASPSCANGSCDSGRLQVGPSRGFFRLFR